MFPVMLAVATAYIVACVIGSSSLFAPIRFFVILRTPFLQVAGHKHFIECRLCLTFWTSLASVLAFNLPLLYLFAVYGAAYWLATQER